MSQHYDFTVIPSDDPDVREADRGFLAEISWTVTAPEGGKSHGVRRVLVPSTADAVVQLGSLYEPTEIPAVTAQRIISGGTASAPLYDIRIRHDDTAGWAAEDPILSLGEEGIDTDTGTRKVGDGVTTWSSLPDRLSDEADARAAADAALDIRVDALEVAPPAHAHPLADVIDAGTAAAADVGDFATAAQGVLADSATQPGHAHAGGDITSGTVAYARLPVGTAASTLAAGDDSRITGAAQKSANLSDLASTATARTNLGLTDSAVVGALPIPDPGSFYPTDTIAAALQLIGGRHIYGTGSPEGVVTASAPTLYTDSAGTNGAWLWQKRSGSGNTGWKVIGGDTGWRKVVGWTSAGVITGTMPTNLNAASGVAGGVFMRRANDQVQFSLVAGVAASASSIAGAIPDGFSSGQVPYPQALIAAITSGSVLTTRTLQAGLITWTIPSPTSGDQFAIGSAYGSTASWLTNQAWPTSLPGTAA